jgi:hypothetical protein
MYWANDSSEWQAEWGLHIQLGNKIRAQNLLAEHCRHLSLQIIATVLLYCRLGAKPGLRLGARL